MNAAAPSPVLLVLAGPAGSGKTTLCERLVSTEPGFARVITATTRPPRPGETDGKDYHFLTPEQFDAKVAAGEFLEWAWVHGKHRYGTLKDAVFGPLEAGQNLIINIDVQGVEHFRRAAAISPLLDRALLTVFITVVPSVALRQRLATGFSVAVAIQAELERNAELKRRMAARGDNPIEIERRIKTVASELQAMGRFDAVIESGTREEDFTTLLTILRGRAAGGLPQK